MKNDQLITRPACFCCGAENDEQVLMKVRHIYICAPCAGDIVTAFAIIDRKRGTTTEPAQ